MKKIIFIGWLVFLCIFSINSVAAEQQVIVFGVTPNYKPYNFLDAAGYTQGFDTAFAQLLCSQMNAICAFQTLLFEDLFTALKEHKIDAALAEITITPERQKHFAFTIPYLPSMASFVAIKYSNKPQLKQITNEILQGKIVGVQIRSIYPLHLQAMFPAAKIKEYVNSEDLLAALINNRVDFIVLDTPAAQYWANQTIHSLYIVGNPIDLNLAMGIMLNQDNPTLLIQLSQAILIVTQSPAYLDLLNTFFKIYPAGRKLINVEIY